MRPRKRRRDRTRKNRGRGVNPTVIDTSTLFSINIHFNSSAPSISYVKRQKAKQRELRRAADQYAEFRHEANRQQRLHTGLASLMASVGLSAAPAVSERARGIVETAAGGGDGKGTNDSRLYDET